MTPLRKKRLLWMAKKPANHKPYYSQYCALINEELVRWVIGHAFLTEAGKLELERLENEL